MGLDLQKSNPFRFARGRAEALDPSRRLQAVDPFGLLSGVFGGPLAGAGQAARWFCDFSAAMFQPRNRLERAFGSFRRVLPLPDGVDAERAEGRFANGVVTLRLPKKAGDGKPSRKLEIQRRSFNP